VVIFLLYFFKRKQLDGIFSIVLSDIPDGMGTSDVDLVYWVTRMYQLEPCEVIISKKFNDPIKRVSIESKPPWFAFDRNPFNLTNIQFHIIPVQIS